MKYTFKRRTSNLPDDVEMQKSFAADDALEALQSASDYWFGGARVSRWLVNGDGVITLLSNADSGNVIGTLMGEL